MRTLTENYLETRDFRFEIPAVEHASIPLRLLSLVLADVLIEIWVPVKVSAF